MGKITFGMLHKLSRNTVLVKTIPTTSKDEINKLRGKNTHVTVVDFFSEKFNDTMKQFLQTLK